VSERESLGRISKPTEAFEEREKGQLYDCMKANTFREQAIVGVPGPIWISARPFFNLKFFFAWRFLQRRFSVVGSELLHRLQGPKNGPHGVGGQCRYISRTLRAIQQPTPRLSISRPAFSCFGSYFELYAVLFTTAPWLSRTVVHKLKQLPLHSLHYHGLQ